MSVLSSALLGILEESGAAVLTLTDTLEEQEFLNAQLTREEAVKHLLTMAKTVASAPPEMRQAMPEIDWDGWALLGKELKGKRRQDGGALWHGVRSLVPATLLWLRVYRQSHPDLFVCKP